MSSLAPRVVLVSRQTEYTALIAAHGTRGQAAFFLSGRGQDIGAVEEHHVGQEIAMAEAKKAIPAKWSFAQVLREDLSRFLFAPNDIIVALGQDGLVANVAKYLDAQPVIGVSPDPAMTEGILTPHRVERLAELLLATANKEVALQSRAMVQAKVGEGQVLTALNELFIGHRSHQSARYVVHSGKKEEFQSSSGMIVATGTGLSGWARSIMTATHRTFEIAPEDRRAAFFAREPWPSRTSGCEISAGEITNQTKLVVSSRINDGGVIFADGIEQDFLPFDWGVQAQVTLSDRSLKLVAC